MSSTAQADPSDDPQAHPRSATATAPVRVCDVGGWTDTWFGSPGQVCSIAMGPAVSATATLKEPEPGAPPVRLIAPDIGLDHRFGPDRERGWDAPWPSVEPLLEHAVAEALASNDPATGPSASTLLNNHLLVSIESSVPPGASLGTSASVVVAVLAAVRALFEPTGDESDGDAETERGSERDAPDLARAAHRVETTRAGREAGVQDHWAAARGGALHLAIDAYPDVRELPLTSPEGLMADIGDRLVTLVLGSHDSSAVHGEVIRAFLTCDAVEHDRVRRASRELASLAAEAARALTAGDLDHWADVLVRSTEAQASMHPGLVGPAHRRAIEAAKGSGGVGWKVNGAGGDGGSISVLAAEGRTDEVRRALRGLDPAWTVLDVAPSADGVRIVRH